MIFNAKTLVAFGTHIEDFKMFRGQYYKTFYGRNYATSGVFPYDFE